MDRPEVKTAIKAFLNDFFADLKAIADGTKPDWGMAPDEYFIRVQSPATSASQFWKAY